MFQSNYWNGFIGKIAARSVDDSDDRVKRWSCRMQLERKQRSTAKVGWRSMLAWSEGNDRGGAYTEAALFSRVYPLKFNVSVGLFDIPSYESRFYRYEYDVPGRGLTRAVWGRGCSVLVVYTWRMLTGRYRYVDSDQFHASSECTMQCDFVF